MRNLRYFISRINLRAARKMPLLAIAVVVAVLAVTLFIPPSDHYKQHPMVGQRLPVFALPLHGNPSALFLPAAWQGKTIVLNIFASWCDPCKFEHALLMRMKEQGIPLYGISWHDSEANTAAYLQQMGNPFLSAGVDAIGEVTLLLGIGGVPETFLIDSAGIIRWKHMGPLDEHTVNNILLPLYQKYAAAP